MKGKIREIVSWVLFVILMVAIGILIGKLLRKITTKANDVQISTISQETMMESSPTSVEEVQPEKKVEFITEEALIAEHVISNENSSENRNINMRIASEIINGQSDGYILQPGDKFSWLEVVGCTSAEKGFKEAPIVVSGKSAQGLGGGVCQVSTAINSAVRKLGIQTNSKKHSKKPKYLKSDDVEATVSYDSKIDFSFQNTLEYPIRINVKTENGSVIVNIFEIRQVQK